MSDRFNKMDDNVEGTIVKSAEQFLSPCSSNVGDIFGDPLVLPRVGDQYQAEIPPLMIDCYHRRLMKKPTDTGVMSDFPNCFALGLPIQIMWALCEIENVKKESLVRANQDHAVDKNWTVFRASEVIIKPLHTPLDNGEIGLSTIHPIIRGDKMDVDFATPEEKKTKLDRADNGYYVPLPGLLSEPWRAIEHDSFLLGLYIFGKDLLLVKTFVKSKEMGDILSYYYGKFYRSNEHRRWSEGRKMRSRRCIHGQKIFIGWRQQELLSRLSSHVSEECQNRLREVSRAFGEGKFSLEEYVFTLKDTVGVGVLVAAVGIGKGKQDLTGTAMDPIKTNNLLSVRPEIPIGKACSTLTSGDIIKFLTGDFRLSKARSNDLFWEAVWPRLLARGWHSEQPKDHHCFASSKHSLVFLIPGVKKFSRRRLVKGNHYFDSVSDVLNKVASDPGLLEVEVEAEKASEQKEEYQSDLPVKQCPDSLMNWQRHCYLQPPASNCNGDLVKFTIVDTSLLHGGGSKFRELRTLPIDTRNISMLSDLSSGTEQDSSDESQYEAEEINASNPAEDTTESETFVDSPELNSIRDNGLPNGPDLTILVGGNHKDWSTGMCTKKKLKGMMKFRFGQKARSDQSNYLAPIAEPCSLGESSPIVENIPTDTKLKEESSTYGLNSPGICQSMEFQVGPSQTLSSCSSLALENPDESDQGIVDLVTEPSFEKPQPETMIDLNLPGIPQDSGSDETIIETIVPDIVHNNDVETIITDIVHDNDVETIVTEIVHNNDVETIITDIVHNNDDLGEDRSLVLPETSQQSSNGGASAEQQPALNGRRQSTRNRPLTTKALEAIACGFLGTKKKRKCVDGQTQSDSMSRSSRLVRGKSDANSTLNDCADNDIA
ncbi:unnamed protein product [Camellia sinensis]